MPRSMTGFGRAEYSENGLTVSVEIKSVNHRFFEFSSRYPRNCQFLEDTLKKTVASRVSRGKVDLSLNIQNESSSSSQITVNEEFAAAYIAALKDLAKKYKLKNDISVMSVAANSDVFTVKRQETDEEQLTATVLVAVNNALDAFVAMRETEGEKLKEDVIARADKILDYVSMVENRSPETVKEYSEKLSAKLNEILADRNVDEQRVLTEVAIFADKVAVAEETVRLRSHIEQLKTMLSEKQEIGRKLDFIVQEMNRETNTIGSKAQDVTIARAVVDMKAEIEKIREQIQNIE